MLFPGSVVFQRSSLREPVRCTKCLSKLFGALGSGAAAAGLVLLCGDESASGRTANLQPNAQSPSSQAAAAGPQTALLSQPPRKGRAPHPLICPRPAGRHRTEGDRERPGAERGFGPPQKPHGTALPRETTLRNPFYLVRNESVVEDVETGQHRHQPSPHAEGQQLRL